MKTVFSFPQIMFIDPETLKTIKNRVKYSIFGFSNHFRIFKSIILLVPNLNSNIFERKQQIMHM